MDTKSDDGEEVTPPLLGSEHVSIPIVHTHVHIHNKSINTHNPNINNHIHFLKTTKNGRSHSHSQGSLHKSRGSGVANTTSTRITKPPRHEHVLHQLCRPGSARHEMHKGTVPGRSLFVKTRPVLCSKVRPIWAEGRIHCLRSSTTFQKDAIPACPPNCNCIEGFP